MTLPEEQQKTMAQAMTQLREQVRHTEAALLEARRQKEEAEEKANASARALEQVRTALTFPVDTVNRSLLYTEELEKGERLNRSQIIRFLIDHGRKMEGTWEKMQVLVSNMSVAFPPSQGTQTPVTPTVTPDKATPSGLAPIPGDVFDLVGTPDFSSPMNWTNLPPLDTEVLKNWKGFSPEGMFQGTPPVFRTPSSFSPPDRRRTFQRPSPPKLQREHSPSGSFRDLLSHATQSAEKMDIAAKVQQEVLPTASSGSHGKVPETTPEEGTEGKGVSRRQLPT